MLLGEIVHFLGMVEEGWFFKERTNTVEILDKVGLFKPRLSYFLI